MHTRKKHRTEQAGQVAGHGMYSTIVSVYDNWGIADIDVANDRYELERKSAL